MKQLNRFTFALTLTWLIWIFCQSHALAQLTDQEAAQASGETASVNIERPNIIFIYTDDLGYGEVGVQGQSIIKTPHIDALAASGMRFTQHYSGAPVCAPARYMLLTGLHAGHAYVRGNHEWAER